MILQPDPPHVYCAESDRNLARVREAMRQRCAEPSTCDCPAPGRLIPMTGTAWGWEVRHANACREHEDQHRAKTVHIHGLAEAVHADYLEAMWTAGDDEDGRGEK